MKANTIVYKPERGMCMFHVGGSWVDAGRQREQMT